MEIAPVQPGSQASPASPPPGQPSRPRRRVDRHWLALAAILVVAGLVFVVGHRYLTPDLVLAHYEDLRRFVGENYASALLSLFGVYLLAASLAVPLTVMLTALAGLLFGWPIGGALAVLAAGTGAIAVFLLARTAVGPLLLRDAGPRMARVSEGLRSDAVSYLLFLRLTPLIPFFLVNVVAALVGIPLRTFAWCTYVGIVPGAFAFAMAGSALDSVIMAQKPAVEACRAAGATTCHFDLSLRTLATPGLLLALFGLGLLALLPALAHRLGWRAGKAREPDAT